MRRLDERGSVGSIISIVTLAILLISSIVFGAWAYSSRQDYKDNADKKITAAVEVAKTQTATSKDNEFLQKEKEPLKTYNGSETFGSVSFKYPKTWSVYSASSNSTPVDVYFNPNYVPGVNATNTYALRLQVVDQNYNEVLKQFDQPVKNNSVMATAFRAKLQPGVLGIKLSGTIATGKTGTLILLPVRDKTIKLSTESSQTYGSDFDNFIVPNLNFVP